MKIKVRIEFKMAKAGRGVWYLLANWGHNCIAIISKAAKAQITMDNPNSGYIEGHYMGGVRGDQYGVPNIPPSYMVFSGGEMAERDRRPGLSIHNMYGNNYTHSHHVGGSEVGKF